jgi:hypothetical protein
MRIKPLFFALFIAFLSSLLGLAYFFSFNHFLFDFSSVLPSWKLISTYCFISFLATFLFVQYVRVTRARNLWVFNLSLSLICFFTICIPILAQVTHADGEFFPVFAIPFHFIFPLFWLTFYPLISPNEKI